MNFKTTLKTVILFHFKTIFFHCKFGKMSYRDNIDGMSHGADTNRDEKYKQRVFIKSIK